MSDFNNFQMISYNQQEKMVEIEKQNLEKYLKFKERIQSFEKITTLEEAKALAEKILPVSKELNRFNVGNAKCVVVNKDDLFRISLDSKEEFISYDFI